MPKGYGKRIALEPMERPTETGSLEGSPLAEALWSGPDELVRYGRWLQA
jgi:hypothetical protein